MRDSWHVRMPFMMIGNLMVVACRKCVFQGLRGEVLLKELTELESLLEKLAQMAAQEAVKATALHNHQGQNQTTVPCHP